jgi:hypothetical protein
MSEQIFLAQPSPTASKRETLAFAYDGDADFSIIQGHDIVWLDKEDALRLADAIKEAFG